MDRSARASACVASRWDAASSASGVRAESRTTWWERVVEPLCDMGASSSTAWALVPPTPKELTAARRGVSPAGQGRKVVLTKKGPASKSICGLAFSKCRLGGISPWCSASAAFIRPASPATVSRWPMLVFSDASGMVPRCSGPSPYARWSAATSIGSPSGVAVPCASTYPMSFGCTPARDSACVMTETWPCTLGAVKPDLSRPSLFVAVARMTA
ncbi:hypothetical protein COSO111634_27445 [Corallococcus soli]